MRFKAFPSSKQDSTAFLDLASTSITLSPLRAALSKHMRVTKKYTKGSSKTSKKWCSYDSMFWAVRIYCIDYINRCSLIRPIADCFLGGSGTTDRFGRDDYSWMMNKSQTMKSLGRGERGRPVEVFGIPAIFEGLQFSLPGLLCRVLPLQLTPR